MIEAVAKFISEHALVKAGERVGVAVSGGVDSVALLRVLLELRPELGVVLAVVHFNHRIRGAESDADERFVRELAAKFELEFLHAEADVPAFAREHGLGLEAAARKLRYEYFATLLRTPRDGVPALLDKIATAHTENDQAETVLMRLVRGAGTRGLSGIRTEITGVGEMKGRGERDVASYISTADTGDVRDSGGAGRVIRPLLAVTRGEVTAYLGSIGQPWREDSSNRQLEHTRNRVRHELIPLLERDFNPAIVHVLAEHARIAQAEDEYWSLEAQQALPVISGSEPGSMRVDRLLQVALPLQRHVIRAAAEGAGVTLDFKHIEAVRRLAAAASGRKPLHAALPGGTAEVALRAGVWELVLRAGGLDRRDPDRRGSNKGGPKRAAAKDYEYRLAVPGSVRVPEIGGSIRARLMGVQEAQVAPQEGGERAFQGYNQAQPLHLRRLLDPARVGAELTVRNWRPGDRFWPAHTKSPKKVKELLQKMTEAERKTWPVILSGNEIVWMRGFPSPASFSLPADAPGQARGLLIDEQQD